MRAVAFAASLVLGCPAVAGTFFSTDVTDLWWNPAESGWGVNVIQQGNIVFATFFVYDSANKAHWYVASNLTAAQATSAGITFQGPLFESTGPFFGVPFDANAVVLNTVGTATLVFTLPSAGVLTYTVNGTRVTKQIVRQTWAANDSSGTYEGSRTILTSTGGSGSTCTPAILAFSSVQIAQSSTSFSMNGTLGGNACRFSGNYSQDGHFGTSTGTFTCASGLAGTYQLTELETSPFGFLARYGGTERGCTLDGRIGGTRTTILPVSQ
jgi:hypothetical protein